MTSLNQRYRLGAAIGRGGMGIVYRAIDTHTQREVAIKTLYAVSAQAALEQFRQEIEILSLLPDHSHVVSIQDVGELNGQIAFVMPLLPGKNLGALIKEERPDVARVIDIISQVCRGLTMAHKHGLVHRDLKPANIFVLPGDAVKIIDFGIAAMVDRRHSIGLRGTLLYMSPEYLEAGQATAQSDIFALGVTCYEALTGVRPFEGPTEEEIRRAILTHIPPPASERNPEVGKSISQVIHKAMAKRPSSRFPSADDFHRCLKLAAAGQPIEYFDEQKIQNRLDRVRQAIDAEMYGPAEEILRNLQEEVYHPEIPQLRRRIEGAVRSRKLGEHLASARQFLGMSELALALERVQRVLDLEPGHAEALEVKDAIERQRDERQIEEWLRLAQEHADHYRFKYAREALDNILELNPGEARALEMRAEVGRREQEYRRKRHEKEELYKDALRAQRDGELTSAWSKIQVVIRLDAEAPDTQTADRYRSYEEIRSQHHTLSEALEAARRLRSEKRYAEALSKCDEVLAKYPAHVVTKGLRFDIARDQQRELWTYLAEVDAKVEAEHDLDRKVAVLKEACSRYPGEPHFEQRLRDVQELLRLVGDTVEKARDYEKGERFSEALLQWETLRTIYPQYPGLDYEIHRVRKREELQDASVRKGRHIEEIEFARGLGDWERAKMLIGAALEEFPNDGELLELRRMIDQEEERTAEAEELLREGRLQMSSPAALAEALTTFERAFELDSRNLQIRRSLLDALLKRANQEVDASDWEAAEQLIERAEQLEPQNKDARNARELIRDHQREEFVNVCLSEALRLEAAGDPRAALKKVREGLDRFPNHQRLRHAEGKLSHLVQDSRASLQRQTDLLNLKKLEQSAGSADRDGWTMILEQSQAIRSRHPDDTDFETIWRKIDSRHEGFTRTIASSPPAPDLGPKSPDKASQKKRQSKPRKPVGAIVAAALAQGRGFAGQRVWRPVREKLAPLSEKMRAPKAALAALIGLLSLAVLLILFIRRAPEAPAPPRTTALSVPLSSDPPGAEIFIDGASQGVAPLTMDLEPGEYVIEARKAGFRPQRLEYALTPSSGAPPPLALTPLPLELDISTDLRRAQISIDGEVVGNLSDEQLDLPVLEPGRHEVVVEGSGGMRASFAFEMTPGMPPTLSPTAEGQPSFETKEIRGVLVGTLGGEGRVFASFDDAGLLVGEGETPVAIAAIGVGADLPAIGPDEALRVRSGRWERELAVRASDSPSLQLFLYSDRDVGSILVQTNEPDVEVLIDGRETNYRRSGDGLRISTVSVGQRTIRVEKEGFRTSPEERTVTIAKNEQETVDFTLEPIPQVSTLRISDGLPETTVSIDGEELGATNAFGMFVKGAVPSGPRRIELSRRGYRSKELPRDFPSGGVVELSGDDVHLERATGLITFENLPPSASLIVSPISLEDGSRPTKRTIPAPIPNPLELSTGRYNLEFHSGEAIALKSDVSLLDGMNRSIEIAFEKAPEQAPTINFDLNLSRWEKRDGAYVRETAGLAWFDRQPGPAVYAFTIEVPGRSGAFGLGTDEPVVLVISPTEDRAYVKLSIERKLLAVEATGLGVNASKQEHQLEPNAQQRIQLEASANSLVLRAADSPGPSLRNGQGAVLARISGDFSKSRVGFEVSRKEPTRIEDPAVELIQ